MFDVFIKKFKIRFSKKTQFYFTNFIISNSNFFISKSNCFCFVNSVLSISFCFNSISFCLVRSFSISKEFMLTLQGSI